MTYMYLMAGILLIVLCQCIYWLGRNLFRWAFTKIGDRIINDAIEEYKAGTKPLPEAVDDIFAFTKDIQYTAKCLNVGVIEANAALHEANPGKVLK